ncbi:hypothetical protein [Arenimonas oryziterrae]|uniref:hypothetical protein n=1 Tax=Arenimonas oryziterrae TaxID=498055 RepID=UPI00138B0401|nr:hypothetical protein [Arenimonas oryziterrae]
MTTARSWLARIPSRVWLGLLLVAGAAEAHVKWFAKADPAEVPRPIGEVLSEPFFVDMLMLSLVAIYFFFIVDRLAVRRGFLADLDARMRRFDGSSIWVMRVCAAIFFLALAAWHWIYGTSFYLTPELLTHAAWVPWLHLVMALCALWRRTAPVTGAGILVLYAAAIGDYGLYHLIDYMIFLGIGYFFLVSAIEQGAWRKSGFIVLFAATGLTLTWAAIEKFAYPQWTYPLLAAKPGMLMGMTPMNYMILAGFVEFNITFVLLGAASMVGRVVAFGLQSVFVLAIFEFGMIDAIGHLMIIAILFVLFFRGPTEARNMLVLRDKGLWTEAYFMTGLYTLALVVMFMAYYGLHHVFYGT